MSEPERPAWKKHSRTVGGVFFAVGGGMIAFAPSGSPLLWLGMILGALGMPAFLLSLQTSDIETERRTSPVILALGGLLFAVMALGALLMLRGALTG
jgi:hypothetical protein